MIETREEAVRSILSGLQYLIQNHATCAASEQYAPVYQGDISDDTIREHKEWVKELRSLREKFEDLVTGLL